MTPITAGGVNVGRRPQVKSGNRTLYVGGLPSNCTEDQLTKIFSSLNKGSVLSVKLIPDKNIHSKGLYYGFVEFDDPAAAEHAMLIMNGRKIYEREIRINWAYQTNTSHKEDTSSHFHIFVGDLSNEVTDEALLQAFQTFGDVSEARVMWDMKTGRTRGYGFVAYRNQDGAVRAISEMDGEWLGSRQIRVNWANQKGQPSMAQSQAMQHAGIMPAAVPGYGVPPMSAAPAGKNDYQSVYNGAPINVVTVYVGNLTPFTTNQDLNPLFSNFGNIVEIRYQQDRGYAFIKFGTHDEAASAIMNLNGYILNGRPLKCSVSLSSTFSEQPLTVIQWGRDRQSDRANASGPHSGAPPSAGPHPGYGYGDQFPQSTPNSAYPHTPAGPYPPYGGYGGPMSPQGTYSLPLRTKYFPTTNVQSAPVLDKRSPWERPEESMFVGVTTSAAPRLKKNYKQLIEGSDQKTGPSPGGPYNPHAAPPMGQPYTPMSGNPSGYGRGDPNAGWAQPGAYPPNQYGAYHG